MPRVVIDPAVPDRELLDNEIARLRGLDIEELRARWHTVFSAASTASPDPPPAIPYFGLSAASRSARRIG
jgi:hypothetical protein